MSVWFPSTTFVVARYPTSLWMMSASAPLIGLPVWRMGEWGIADTERVERRVGGSNNAEGRHSERFPRGWARNAIDTLSGKWSDHGPLVLSTKSVSFLPSSSPSAYVVFSRQSWLCTDYEFNEGIASARCNGNAWLLDLE